jgi:hypothetical protein
MRREISALFVRQALRSIDMPARDEVDMKRIATLPIWLFLVAASGPTADSVSPASGSGTTHTFTFKFSDPAGHAALVNARQHAVLALSVPIMTYYLPSILATCVFIRILSYFPCS